MGIINCTAILAVISIGWLPASCSKKASAQKNAPSTNNVAKANEKNLGQLTLTNHYETCVEIGSGKSCLITPRILDAKNMQLTMSLQSKNAEGKTDALSVTQVIAQPGKPFEVAIGGMNLILIPQIGE
jgi:hypothetical protein